MTAQITVKMQKAAILIAAGKGPSQVAKIIKVSRTQLYEWRKKPEFQSLVTEESAELLASARGALSAAASNAVKELVSLMESSKSESVRLRAAQTVISELDIGNQGPHWAHGPVDKSETVDQLLSELGWNLND